MMKTRYLFAGLVLFILNAPTFAIYGGAPVEEWNITYKGMGWAGDIIETDGGYILAVNKPSGSLQLISLVKIDQKGNAVWNRTIGPRGYNEIISIDVTGNNGYVLSGSHRNEMDPNTDIMPPRILILIRTDASGNELWNLTLESSRAYPFYTTSDGGMIIAGETSLRFSDLWLSKFSADGKDMWKKTFERGEKLARTDAVYQTSDGGYLIAGKNISCCGWGDFDMWLVRTDAGGNVQWKKSFEEFRYVTIYSIHETPDSDYIFAGNYGCTFWIWKFDPSGKELWSKSFSGFAYKHFQKTPDGGFLASGENSLMKIDAEGNKQWMVNFKNSGITSLKQSSDGGFITAGYGFSDMWLVKLKRGPIPFISFTPDFPGRGQPVTFDTSLSYDPDGNIAGFRWDFGDGNITETNGKKIVHSYSSEGSFNFSLTLMDKDNTVIGSIAQKLEVQKSMPPEERWNRTYGGKDADWEKSASKTRDGGLIMAGDTSFLYGIGAYLVKVDPDGNEEWNKTYAVIDGQSAAKSVVQTSDGGYVFSGSRQQHSEFSQKIWLVKTDRFGNEQWNRTFGKPGSIDDFSYNDGFSVIEDSNGSFVVTGIIDLVEGMWGESRFGLLLARTDKDGNKLWEKTRVLNGSIEAYSVLESINGGYSVVGTSYMGSLMTTSAWLLKVDQNGNEKWLKTYSGIGTSPIAYSMQQTLDGGYIVAGNMWKYSPDTGNLIDLWIMKTDREGNTLWQKTYEGGDYESARYVLETQDGGYIILADRNGAGIWLIKTDMNGSVQWQQMFEGTSPSSVVETSDSGYIIGAVKDESCGNRGSDFWLIKLGGSRIEKKEAADQAAVNETHGREENSESMKARGFEWVFAIFTIMVVAAFRKRGCSPK